MEFNSYIYVFAFLPIVLAGYLTLRRTRLANLFLSIASFVFYAWMAVWYLVPLLISSVLDYVIGRRIAAADDVVSRRRLLVLSIVVNLGMLSVFKYAGWVSSVVSDLAAVFGLSISAISLGLPPGISFYTFQTMSYTIDIYKREFRPRKNIVDYLSFVSFFPQLVAGPIERASRLLPQLEKTRDPVSLPVAASACFMILFGLFQKIVLADNFGGIVEFAVRNINTTSKTPLAPGMGLVFTYAFAFQIYCDFSAYSTIARGTARLFGIDLMRNFATPYFARNPSDFWRRWHISLSTWLRDYLYIPLGGSRNGRLATMRNLMITMVLGGLWHGAGFFFILWGLWHGLLLVFYHIFPLDTYLERRLGWLGRLLSTFLFFHLVCVGWIFFRATPEQLGLIVESILAFPVALGNVATTYLPYWGQAWQSGSATALLRTFLGTLKGMLTFNHNVAVMFWGLTLFGGPTLLADWLGYRKGVEFADLWERMPTLVRVVCILFLIYCIIFFGKRQANEFIYFQF